MKLNMTWAELARAAGGRLAAGVGEAPVDSISTDTRTLSAGQAFWALKGERFDAHDLLASDGARRASGWIVEKDRPLPAGPWPAHIVEVANTLRGLQALAAFHRRRFELPVAGVTGSNGKTTTKEMLKRICARLGPTCSSPGNWNNQIGVPLSVLELLPEHKYGVFELADSHPGDIAEVARVAWPTVAVLTNIGRDHLEFYGTIEANFKTKSEILDHLHEDGKAAVNIDDPWLAGLEPRLGARAITFGMNPRAKVSFSSPDEMIIDRHKVRVKLKAFGELSRYNAAAAAAAALGLGIDADTIRAGLEDYAPSMMRLEPRRHPSGCEIVLDAYNANPDSMRASIQAFCEAFPAKKRLVALGDMKELGAGSAQFHRELGQWLATLPLRAVYLAGPEMKEAADELSSAKPSFRFHYAAQPSEWLESLRREVGEGSALFVKASRAMKFETIVDSLTCSTT